MEFKEIYIVRHGETDANRKGIVQGRGVDSDLNERGKKQAKALYDYYQNLSFDGVFISALVRTRQTLKHFEPHYPLQVFPALDEVSWGVQEGKFPSQKMKRDFRTMLSHWAKGELHLKVEGGESPLEVQERLMDFVDHIRLKDYRRILVCTHGRTGSILLCILLGVSLKETDSFRHKNTAVSKIIQHPGETLYRTVFLNNTEHLNQASP